ncbi:hypothetical protein NA57DRAFT_56728 [Rhizodiscina lignyota]|uniref:Uncharacterized protein n=1 Tax=Rhizodiscina lignyota TaxID=1504668 RepID=A0A9P4IDZ8_9PEZI|nr:hypothetical protein NA57DRAFT_56728 [Rhizodiscina lignyota]
MGIESRLRDTRNPYWACCIGIDIDTKVFEREMDSNTSIHQPFVDRLPNTRNTHQFVTQSKSEKIKIRLWRLQQFKSRERDEYAILTPPKPTATSPNIVTSDAESEKHPSTPSNQSKRSEALEPKADTANAKTHKTRAHNPDKQKPRGCDFWDTLLEQNPRRLRLGEATGGWIAKWETNLQERSDWELGKVALAISKYWRMQKPPSIEALRAAQYKAAAYRGTVRVQDTTPMLEPLIPVFKRLDPYTVKDPVLVRQTLAKVLDPEMEDELRIIDMPLAEGDEYELIRSRRDP